jgi:hypothetical protein
MLCPWPGSGGEHCSSSPNQPTSCRATRYNNGRLAENMRGCNAHLPRYAFKSNGISRAIQGSHSAFDCGLRASNHPLASYDSCLTADCTCPDPNMIDVSHPVFQCTTQTCTTEYVSDNDPNIPPEVVESIDALFIRCEHCPDFQTDCKVFHRLL